jgi:hypothetical protein
MPKTQEDALTSLQDRAEIADLLARYCVALDTREFEMLETVFTSDAHIDYGNEFASGVGAPWFTAFATAGLASTTATHHQLGTSIVQLSDAGAEGRTYVVAQHVGRGDLEGSLFTVAGWYLDRFVSTDQGWRIAERAFVSVWTDGNADVLSG